MPAKKKKATKKKATKRKSSKKTAAPKPANPLSLTVAVKSKFKVERGTVYEVTLKGESGKLSAGHVTAKSDGEAKKKAKALLRRRL